MADFYPVLKRAVAALPAGNIAGRQAVYRRARLALDRQLAGYDPSLPQHEVDDQRAALDRAIALIETELGPDGDVLLAGRVDAPAARAPSVVAATPPESPKPPEPVIVAPVPAPEEPTKPAASSRWGFSRTKSVAEPTELPPAARSELDQQLNPKPLGSPQDRAEPKVSVAPQPLSEAGDSLSPGLGAMSKLAAAQRRGVRDEGAAKADKEAHPVLAKASMEPVAHEGVPTDARIMLQAHPTLATKAVAFAKNPLNFSAFVGFILIVLVGSLGWMQREQLGQWFHPAKAGVTGVQASDATNDGLGPKIEDRLPPDESLVAPATGAKSVATQKVTADKGGLAAAVTPGATVTYSEDTSSMSTSFARNNDELRGADQPAANSTAVAGSTAQKGAEPSTAPPAIAPKVPVAISPAPQRVILYEEPLPGSTPVPLQGTAVWSLVNQAPLPGEAVVPQVRVDISIPDRDLMVTLLIRANSDPNFPASHLVDMQFVPGPQFPGRRIQLVTRLILKPTEKAGGDPLNGAVIQIIDNRFWLALSNEKDARATNVDLLRKRTWFDIPVLYGDRRRAIIALDKGEPGTSAINQGFAVFGE